MIDRESGADPDKAEGDETCRIKLLMEIETSHQELDRRIDVHQDAGQVIRDLTDSVVEQSKGNRLTIPARGSSKSCGPDRTPMHPVRGARCRCRISVRLVSPSAFPRTGIIPDRAGAIF